MKVALKLGLQLVWSYLTPACPTNQSHKVKSDLEGCNSGATLVMSLFICVK